LDRVVVTDRAQTEAARTQGFAELSKHTFDVVVAQNVRDRIVERHHDVERTRDALGDTPHVRHRGVDRQASSLGLALYS